MGETIKIETQALAVERNLLTYPLFVTSKVEVGKPLARTITHWVKVTETVIGQDEEDEKVKTGMQVSVTISAPKAAGPRDMEAFRLVERKLHLLAMQSGGSLPKEQVGVIDNKPVYKTEVDLGSMYELLKELGWGTRGKDYSDLLDFFDRMQGYTILSRGAFYSKQEGRRIGNWKSGQDLKIYHSYSMKKVSDDKGREVSSSIKLCLDQTYAENINSRHIKLLDFKVYSKLKPVGKRLYEVLILRDKFFLKPEGVWFNYAEFCKLMAFKEYTQSWEIKRQMAVFVDDMVGEKKPVSSFRIVTQKGPIKLQFIINRNAFKPNLPPVGSKAKKKKEQDFIWVDPFAAMNARLDKVEHFVYASHRAANEAEDGGEVVVCDEEDAF